MHHTVIELVQTANVVVMDVCRNRDHRFVDEARDRIFERRATKPGINEQVCIPASHVLNVAAKERMYMWFPDQRYVVTDFTLLIPAIRKLQHGHRSHKSKNRAPSFKHSRWSVAGHRVIHRFPISITARWRSGRNRRDLTSARVHLLRVLHLPHAFLLRKFVHVRHHRREITASRQPKGEESTHNGDDQQQYSGNPQHLTLTDSIRKHAEGQ